MIALDSVTFSYGDRRILADLSLTFADGMTTAILGPSGCGKTTIVRLVSGLLQPSAGSVSVGPGVPAALGSVRGVLFQDDTLLPWLTVKQNAFFPRHLSRSGDAPASVATLLRAFGLGYAFEYLPSQLSSGMKKRVELVRALLADKRFLIGDEPFTGLDSAQKKVLWDIWRDRTVSETRVSLLVSHDIDEALYVSDQIIVLSAASPTSVILTAKREDGKFPGELRGDILALMLSNSPTGGRQ
jgi:ABC-type nitrate/sulfonate/bicarbonate transport system ATPase subunit